MPELTIGVDLGKTNDYTAICVLETERDGKTAMHHARHLERFRIGLPYPRQVERIVALRDAVAKLGTPRLVVDQTGVGQAVVDMLRDAGLRLTAVTITGGDSLTRGPGGDVRIPKRDLISSLQVAVQNGQLKVSAANPLAGALEEEMLAFRVSINDRGHDSYGNDSRESGHDDLVLALALAVWQAERARPPVHFTLSQVGVRHSEWDV